MSIPSRSTSVVKMSRTNPAVRPTSLWMSAGARFFSAELLAFFQSLTRNLRSRLICRLLTPSAAVRTMSPPHCGRISRAIAFRRSRSSDFSILRETPIEPEKGTSTRKRPGSEICVVTRGPFVLIGSFVTWTRISWFFLRRSWIGAFGATIRWPSSISSPSPPAPALSPMSRMSETCRKALFSKPMSMKDACMPGRTAPTTPL